MSLFTSPAFNLHSQALKHFGCHFCVFAQIWNLGCRWCAYVWVSAAKSSRRTRPGLSQRGGSRSIPPCAFRACLLDLLCGLWLIPGYERERERESMSGLGGAALLFFCLIWLSDGKDRVSCKNISTQPGIWMCHHSTLCMPLLFFPSLIFSLLRSRRSCSRRRHLSCYWHRDMVLIRWQTRSDIFLVMSRLALFLT